MTDPDSGTMERRDASFFADRRWVVGTLFVLVFLAAGAFWFIGRFEKHWRVPHGIYASGDLVNGYHLYRAKQGRWPEPGALAAKEVEFVRSYEERGKRIDVYNFGGGQFALFELGNGSIQVLPTRDPPTPSPASSPK